MKTIHATPLSSYIIQNLESSWNYFTDLVPANFKVWNGGTVVFNVNPEVQGMTGTYLLEINVQRTLNTGTSELGIRNYELRIYPDPVDQTSVINYHLSENSKVNISMYDCMGRNCKSIFNGAQSEGDY